MKKALVLLMLLAFSAPAQARGLVRAYDVDKIELGDTVKRVQKTLGEPHQVVSQETTPDGKQKLVWRYELAPPRSGDGNLFSAIGGFLYKPPRVDEYGLYHQGSLVGGIIGEDEGQAARNRQAYFNTPQGQAARAQVDQGKPQPPKESSCTITFVDRKVTGIVKQQPPA